MIIKGYIFSYLYFILIPIISYILNKGIKAPTIIIRKLTHIIFSLIWIIMYYYLEASIHLVIVAFSYVLLNILAYKLNLFKLFLSNGEYLGIVYYFFSIFILSLITFFHNDYYLAASAGILCMGFGDGFAPLIARLIKSNKLINDKSFVGFITVFVMSVLVIISFNYFLHADFKIYEMITIGISAAILELFGNKGLDNLYLPLGVSFIVLILGGI